MTLDELPEKLCLLLLGLALGFLYFDGIALVAAFLIATSLGGFLMYLERPALRRLLLALWAVAALFLPALGFFSGIFVHESLAGRQRLVLLALLPAVLSFSLAQGAPASFVLLVVLVLAALLARRALTWRQLSDRYYRLSDQSKELSARLELRQQHLLESQDAEIQLATLGERNRIARDIHDNVGHLLSSALLQTAALRTTCTASGADSGLEAALGNLHATLHAGMDAIRSSVHHLHASSLDLEQHLRKLLAEFSFCETKAHIDLYRNPPRDCHYAILSVVKEALSNAARHSDASLFELRLREHPAFYQLVLADNGSPARPGTVGPPLSKGLGLHNISDRVEALGGRLHIDRHSGFSLFITIPKEPGDDSRTDNR